MKEIDKPQHRQFLCAIQKKKGGDLDARRRPNRTLGRRPHDRKRQRLLFWISRPGIYVSRPRPRLWTWLWKRIRKRHGLRQRIWLGHGLRQRSRMANGRLWPLLAVSTNDALRTSLWNALWLSPCFWLPLWTRL